MTSVLWWYYLPIIVPLIIVALRSEFFDAFRTAYVAGCLALVAFIVSINRRIVRKKLSPRRAWIDHLLKEVEANGDAGVGPQRSA